MTTDRPGGNYLRLDVAARRARIPPARVRSYVRAGLVRPAHTQGRLVLFTEAELARLRKIRRLRDDLGINLAGVEVVLRLLDELEVLRASRPEPTRLTRAADATAGPARVGGDDRIGRK